MSIISNFPHNNKLGEEAGKAVFTDENGALVAKSATDARTAIGVSYGNVAGTVCEGNDARLSDARTPTAHTHDVTDMISGMLTSDRLPIIPVIKGGTGAESAKGALANLGVFKLLWSGSWSSGSITVPDLNSYSIYAIYSGQECFFAGKFANKLRGSCSLAFPTTLYIHAFEATLSGTEYTTLTMDTVVQGALLANNISVFEIVNTVAIDTIYGIA